MTCLIIPHDVQELDAVPTPPRKHGTVHSGLGVAKPDIVPAKGDLARAADVLNAGTKVAMLVGAGARDAADEINLVGDGAAARSQVRVERPDQIGSAWDNILSADRPGVFEACVDPNVAPLPPHVSVEQAKNFLASILKGDAQTLGFVKQIAKDVAAGYLPAKK